MIGRAIGLLLVLSMAAPSPARAASSGDLGVAIGGLLIGIVANAIKKDAARKSWAGVPDETKNCLASRHAMPVESLISGGVLLSDQRLAPALTDCREFFTAQQQQQAAQRRRIEQTQRFLTDLGYDPGPIDGVMGGRTEAALIEFERDQNLPVRGEISDSAIAQLRGQVERLREQDARLAAQAKELQGQSAVKETTEPDPTSSRAPLQLQPQAGSGVRSAASVRAAEPAFDARREQVIALHGKELADQILAGKIVVGMTMDQAFAAHGKPSRKDVIPPDDELWYYEDARVVFYKGKVTHVEQAPRSLVGQSGSPPSISAFRLADLSFAGGCGVTLSRPGRHETIFHAVVPSMQAAMFVDGALVTFQRTETNGIPLPYGQFPWQVFNSLDGTVRLIVELNTGEAPSSPEAEVRPMLGEITVLKTGSPKLTVPVTGNAGC